MPLASLHSGYQHVYFNDSSISYDLLHPPSSLFVNIQVYFLCICYSANFPLDIQLKGNDVAEIRELEAEACDDTLFVKLSVKDNVEVSSVTITLNEVLYLKIRLWNVIYFPCNCSQYSVKS